MSSVTCRSFIAVMRVSRSLLVLQATRANSTSMGPERKEKSATDRPLHSIVLPDAFPMLRMAHDIPDLKASRLGISDFHEADSIQKASKRDVRLAVRYASVQADLTVADQAIEVLVEIGRYPFLRLTRERLEADVQAVAEATKLSL